MAKEETRKSKVTVLKEGERMSKDISTPYTKQQNKKCGRKGYCGFKREKVADITPKNYREFLWERKRKNYPNGTGIIRR